MTSVVGNVAASPITSPINVSRIPPWSINVRRWPCAGSKRRANAHLVRPLDGGVRNHAVDAHGGEQQRHRGKRREERVHDTVGQHRLIHDLFERADIAQRLVPVDAVNGQANGSLQRLGRHAGSHDEIDAVGRALLVRDVHAGADLIAEPGDLLTRNDADDFPGDLLAELSLARYDFSHQDAATDRVLIGKLPLGQRLVDERDRRCARLVVVAQHTSCNVA